MRTWFKLAAAVLLALACASPLLARAEEVHKEFDGVKSIRIRTVSGDCIVKTHRSDKTIVDLVYDVEPEGAFDYAIEERGSRLVIKERWRSGSGEVTWTLTVPEGTNIEHSTASGDLEVAGPIGEIETSSASGDIELGDVSGEIKVSTASGDVDIVKAEGEMRISTASGDVEARNVGGEIRISTASGEIDLSDSKGAFELSCASGEITARGIEVEDASGFSTASGSVKVVLAKTSEHDLSLSAASGDVTLDYNGNPVRGHFEFEARKRNGRISCPFDFEEEEEFEEWDQVYVRKSFSKGGNEPEIHLSTSSGRIVLKK